MIVVKLHSKLIIYIRQYQFTDNKMKSLFRNSLLIVISLSILSLSSCLKKGEDDPAISLRSRTSRLAGIWKLSGTTRVEKTEDKSQTPNRTTTVTYSYDGTTLTKTIVSKIGNANATTLKQTSTFSSTFTINKDNTFKMETVSNGYSNTDDGNWAWLGSDKPAKLKSKEAFVTFVTKNTDPLVTTYTGTQGSMVYVLNKLSNKELDMDLSYTASEPDGSSTVIEGTETYVQQ
jgi:hypothetical protein